MRERPHSCFLAKVEKAAGRKGKKIVVYCAGVDCDAASKAAAKLTAAGHGDVGGLAAPAAQEEPPLV